MSPLVTTQPERLFDSFERGKSCGRATFSLDKEFADRLNALLDAPQGSDRLPMAAVPLLLMRAYTTVLSNRPPGNIHVAQICNLFELPRHDAVMLADVTCIHKEAKRSRLVLQLSVTLTDETTSNALMSGISTIFWAA